MRAVGQKGGRRAPGDKALADSLPADDPLRVQAREELQRLLASDNEQVRLRAATSLFGYGTEKPISEAERKGWNTQYSGTPATEVAAILRDAYGDEPIEILPSPGDVMAARGKPDAA
jgi:hypothetical protein